MFFGYFSLVFVYHKVYCGHPIKYNIEIEHRTVVIVSINTYGFLIYVSAVYNTGFSHKNELHRQKNWSQMRLFVCCLEPCKCKELYAYE